MAAGVALGLTDPGVPDQGGAHRLCPRQDAPALTEAAKPPNPFMFNDVALGCRLRLIAAADVVSRTWGGCKSRVRSLFLNFYHGESLRATKGHGGLPCCIIGN